MSPASPDASGEAAAALGVGGVAQEAAAVELPRGSTAPSMVLAFRSREWQRLPVNLLVEGAGVVVNVAVISLSISRACSV